MAGKSQKVKIIDLDNVLKNLSLEKVSPDDCINLMLINAIRQEDQAVYLQPKGNKIEYFIINKGEKYTEGWIPGFKSYTELIRRAQNSAERSFIARYHGKDHLVEMSVQAGEDSGEMLELKIAA
jgi:hypothetical protein